MITMDLIPDITKKGRINLVDHKEGILDIAHEMEISFVSYKDVYKLFDYLKSQIDTESQYSSTIMKLIQGMQNELSERRLNI